MGVNFDLSKYFGGKGVIPMAGMTLGIVGYFFSSYFEKFPQFDAFLAGVGCTLLFILICIGIGELNARSKRRRAFASLDEEEIRVISKSFGQDGYSNEGLIYFTTLSLCDKGIASKVTVEGIGIYRLKLNDWAKKLMRKDPRFKN
jgi:hypothetical protein